VLQTTTPNSATSFTPSTNLQAGTYRLWVRGVAADGMKGQWSTLDEFSVVPSTTITKISQQFTYRPKFEFTPVPGVTVYELWINNLTTPSTPPIRITTATTNTNFTPTNNLASGNYRVWIRGIGEGGKLSEWSSAKDFSVGTRLQFNQANSTIAPGSPFTFSWGSQDGAARYQIWRSAPGQQPSAGIVIYEGTATTFTTSDLSLQGVYKFWLRPVAEVETPGAWSNVLEVLVSLNINTLAAIS
jgi:predicted phage tail protein